MRTLAALAAFLSTTSACWAGCAVGVLPFNLQEGQTASATQVMANFNQIVNGVNSNCASAGVNNDITSLSGLTTPLPPSEGGTAVYVGSTSTGTNAITIATTTPAPFVPTTGYSVVFVAGATNTGPITAIVGSAVVKNVLRRTQFGLQTTRGAELIVGNTYTFTYDGVEYVIANDFQLIGEMKNYAAGTSPPPGWFTADGSTFVCSTYQELCNVIGTIYGGTSTNPALPDTRGRVLAGVDNGGVRLNGSGTGCGSFFGIGASCANGSQSHTQSGAELAVHSHGASASD